MSQRIVAIAATVALTSGMIATNPTISARAADDKSVLTLLATTDVHGHVFNWDYFADKEYAAKAPTKADGTVSGSSAPLGMSRAATIIERTRAERGADSVLYVDNGDAVQGTPLTYLAAVQPALLSNPSSNPIAHAYNLLGAEAQVVGNHEFNYGLDYLASYQKDFQGKLLGANVTNTNLAPSTVITKKVQGHDVKVGIVGVTTPGSAVWDKANLAGKVDLTDPVAAAKAEATKLKSQGVDIVVVLAHMGIDLEGASPINGNLMENLGTSVAEKAPNVDVVVIGHTHRDAISKTVDGASGHKVLITQPTHWARSVADVQIPLTFTSAGKAEVDRSGIDKWATQRYTNTETESPTFAQDQQLVADHKATVKYVNSVVAKSTEAMSTEKSMIEDSKILDFIGSVQANTVDKALDGTEYANIPVIAQVSPFSRTAVFPQGNVAIKDIAGLYVFDNTLGGVLMDGKQIKEYLEYSAKYYKQANVGDAVDPVVSTNAEFNKSVVPDYNYDVLTGVSYAIDISKPVGERILHLKWQGKDVTADQKFILAVNNYRMNGGGGYPNVATAPVVYNKLLEIRQLLIDTARTMKAAPAPSAAPRGSRRMMPMVDGELGVIDPAAFATVNWMVTTNAATLPKWVLEGFPTPTPQDLGGTTSDKPVPKLARTGK
ncbi:MAG: bifunctional metallophosphatase/5'-nucleotidase [Propionibacteriaceae bacterium]